MEKNTLTGTDANFLELIGSPLPTLVDFWAEWCGPCKMMDGPLEEIAAERAGVLQIVKFNVDENPSTAMQFGVMSIPTMIIFQQGQEKKRLVGARSKAQMEAELASFVS
ncbi:MAG: thioredoxin [Actinomycetota bacterium]